MAMGATVVASDVAPVREAVTDGETGLLFDFFRPDDLADRVIGVLADPEGHAHLGRAARAHVVREYDFLTRCLPEHLRQINALLPPDRALRL
jgi:glycosyltransferase involved in cell wall biosynthesis